MIDYKKCGRVASICVALFIISAAFLILVFDNWIYNNCIKGYTPSQESVELSTFEMEMNHKQLNDSFTKFFKKECKIAGYDISSANQNKLRKIKRLYRLAWIISVLSLYVGVRCFIILSKRRAYMPLLYGGLGAMFLTACNALIIMCSHSGLFGGIKEMILHQDYSYFGDEDILGVMFPPSYARFELIGYVGIVFGLVLLMNCIRLTIIFLGRPHKF